MKLLQSFPIIFILLLIITCFSGVSNAQDRDHCNDVLTRGVFNIVRVNSYDKIEENYLTWLKTVNKEEAKSATKLGLDLTLPVEVPVNLGANFTDQEWAKWERQREDLTTYSFKREAVLERFSRTIDQGLVSAWRDCMRSREQQIGLRLDTRTTADKIVLTLSWTIPGNEAAEIQEWSSVNATLNEGSTKPDRVESLRPVSLIYNITDRTKPTIFTIRTNRGTVTDIVSPQPPPPTETLTIHIALRKVAWTHYFINRPSLGNGAELVFQSGGDSGDMQISPAFNMKVISSSGQGLLQSRFQTGPEFLTKVKLKPSDSRLEVSVKVAAGGAQNRFDGQFTSAYSVSLKELRSLLTRENVINRTVPVVASAEGKGRVEGEATFEISLVPKGSQ